MGDALKGTRAALTMPDRSSILCPMNKLDTARRTAIVSALVEGMSIRATCRMTDTAKGTVLRLLADLGPVCRDYMDRTLVNLPCRKVQCDEIWQFCYAKQKNLPESMKDKAGVGSVWTWVAICADTKLIPSFHVGTRDAGCAYEFMVDLAGRLRGRIQLTTDGHAAYLNAVRDAFGRDIDYAMLVKLYGEAAGEEHRYSPLSASERVWMRSSATRRPRTCRPHLSRDKISR